MATGRVAEAEPFFKKLAATVDTPAIQATLAQYYLVAGRRDAARRVLTEVLQRKDGEALATVRLAAHDAVEGQRAQAEERLRDFLAKAPTDLSAQLLYGEILIRGNKRDEADAAAKAAIALDANSARAHALAAAIAVQGDRLDAAVNELETVLRLDPRALGAVIELSRLQLVLGNIEKSFAYAQQALQMAPGSSPAQSLLVRNHLARGEGAKAAALVATLQKGYPNAPALFNLMALVQLFQNNPTGARASFAKALAVDPDNIEGLSGVVRLDVGARRAKEATTLLDGAAARPAASVDFLLAVADGYWISGDPEKSESVLKRAIEVEPGRLRGYQLLGQLYARQKRLDEARKQFEELLTRDSTSIPAQTMVGMIHEAQGRVGDAEKSYQRVLGINPRSAVAANNLAWIYVASNRELDAALRLAQTAAELLVDEPNVNDTLGWIYVKKDLPARAVPVLEAAVKKVPDDASFRYHLGMAYFKAGDWKKSRSELERALALKLDVEGSAEARKTLAIVGGAAAS